MANLDFNSQLNDGLTGPIQGIIEILKELGQTLADITTEMSTGMDDATSSTEDLAAVFDDLSNASEGVAATLGDTADALLAALEGSDSLSESTDALSVNFEALAEAMTGALAGTDALTTAQTELLLAIDAVKEGLAVDDEEFVALTTEEEDAAAAADQLAEAYTGLAAAAGEVGTANEAEAATFAQTIDDADALIAANDQLQASIDGVITALADETGAMGSEAVATDTNTLAAKDNADKQKQSGFSGLASAGILNMIGLAAVGVGVGMVKMGIASDTAFTLVQSMAGASAADMAQYRGTVDAMAPALGRTTTEMAKGLYQVVSVGYSGAGAMTVLKEAAMAASASGAQMSDVSNALTSALKVYGQGANEAASYTDTMVSAVVNGKQTFGQFSQAMGVLAVTGATTHFTFQEVAAGEATMTQAGLTSRRAVTDLDNALRAIGLSNDKVATTAASLGLNFDKAKYSTLDLSGKLNYLKSISGDNQVAFEKLVGGATGLTAAQILLTGQSATYTNVTTKAITNVKELTQQTAQMGIAFDATRYATMNTTDKLKYLQTITKGNTDEFSQLVGGTDGVTGSVELLNGKTNAYSETLGKMKGNTNATAKAFAIYQQSIGYAVSQLKASFSVLDDKLTQLAKPEIVAFLKELANAMQYLSDHTQLIGPILGALGVGLGALVLTSKPAVKALEGMGKGFEVLKGGFGEVMKVSQGVGDAIGAPLRYLTDFGGRIGNIGSLLGRIPGPMQIIENGFSSLGRVSGLLQGGMQGVMNIGERVFSIFSSGESFVGALQGGLTALMGVFQGGVAGILGAAGALSEFLLPILLIAGAITLGVVIFTSFRKQFVEMAESIMKAVKPSFDAIEKSIKGALSSIQTTWKQVWPQLKPAIDSLLASVKSATPFFQVLGTVIQIALQIVIGIIVGLVTAFIKMLPTIAAVFGSIFKILGVFGEIIQAIFSGQFGKIPGLILSLLGNIAGLFKNGLALVAGFVGNAVSGIIGSWIGMGAKVLQPIKNLVDNILGFFKGLWQDLVGHSVVPDMINGIVGFFAGLPGKILGGLAGFVGNVIGNFTSLASGAISHVTGMVSGVVGLFTGQSQKAAAQAAIQKDKVAAETIAQKDIVLQHTAEQAEKSIALMQKQRAGLVEQLKGAKTDGEREAIESKIKQIDQATQSKEAVVQKAKEMHEQAIDKIKKLKEDVATHMKDMHQHSFLDNLTDLPGKMISIGGDIIKGLLSGMKNVPIIGGITDAASGVISGFQNLFKSKSPSQVFAAMGGDLMAGLQLGIQNGTGATTNMIRTAAGQIISGGQSVLATGLSTTLAAPRLGVSTGVSGSAGGTTPIVTVNVAGDMASGLSLLNPSDRVRLVRQIGVELGNQIALQGKLPNGYSGY